MPCSFVDDYYQHGYYGGVPSTYMSIYWKLNPTNNPVPWSIKMYGEEKVKEMMSERLKGPDMAVNSYFTKILTTWPPQVPHLLSGLPAPPPGRRVLEAALRQPNLRPGEGARLSLLCMVPPWAAGTPPSSPP